MTTPQQAIQVLAKISLLDPFFPKPDAGMAMAWAETLSVHGLDIADLMDAVPMLFADETRTRDRVLPIDVIVKARAIRKDRLERDPHERDRIIDAIDAKVDAIENRPIREAIEPRQPGDFMKRLRQEQTKLEEETA